MKNSAKAFTPLAIILIIAGVLVLAGGGFYLYQRLNIKDQNLVGALAQNQQQVANKLPELKFYQNYQYGFQFNYPPDLKVEHGVGDFGKPESVYPDGVINLKIYDSNYKAPNGATGQDVREEERSIDLFVYKNSAAGVIQLKPGEAPIDRLDAIKNDISGGEPKDRPDLWSEEDISVNGGIVKLYKLWSGLAGNYYEAYFVNDKYIYEFTSFQKDLVKNFLATFKLIPADPNKISANINGDWVVLNIINYEYAKDSTNVYINQGYTEYDWQKIEGADPATFQIFDISERCFSVEKSESFYAKDKNHVYCSANVIPGADPKTFEYLGSYDDNPQGLPMTSGVAKDKSCVYRRNEKILDSSGRCINPAACTSASLASNPSICGITGPWGEFR